MNRVSSDDEENFVLRTLRSVTDNILDGNPPAAIPPTDSTPLTVTDLGVTPVTLAMIGSSTVVSVYSTKSFSLTTFPGNFGLLLIIVLIPLAAGLIVAIPTTKEVDGIISALKVLIPVFPPPPNTDLASEIPCAVTATAILPSSIPLKISLSLGIKEPLVS